MSTLLLTSLAATLVVLSCMSLATWSVWIWFSTRHVFFGLLYLLALLAAMMGGFAVIHIPFAWTVGLGIAASIVIFLFRFGTRLEYGLA